MSIHDPYCYNVTLNLDLAELTGPASSVTSHLLSYILSVDFETLNPQVKDFVMKWVRDNCEKIGLQGQNEVFQMRQSVALLMYNNNE